MEHCSNLGSCPVSSCPSVTWIQSQLSHVVFLPFPPTTGTDCRFLLEGQEEIGSPNLPDFLTSHAQGLLAGVDLVLNADGGQVSATQPGICTGMAAFDRLGCRALSGVISLTLH